MASLYTDTMSKHREKPTRPFQKSGICVFDLNWVFCALGGEISTLNHFLTLFQANATCLVLKMVCFRIKKIPVLLVKKNQIGSLDLLVDERLLLEKVI